MKRFLIGLLLFHLWRLRKRCLGLGLLYDPLRAGRLVLRPALRYRELFGRDARTAEFRERDVMAVYVLVGLVYLKGK